MRIWPVTTLPGGKVVITGSDAKHIITVLRKKKGDNLKIAAQDGRIFDSIIDEVTQNSVSVNPVGSPSIHPLKKPDIYLALGISKPSVMELVVQKGVELGCNRLFLIPAERSISPALSNQKVVRLEKVAHEALKQCGRAEPMEISTISIDELPEADMKILLWEEEKKRTLKELFSQFKNPNSVLILVGPPAGFTEMEVEKLKTNGFATVGMGRLILRTETAALAILSILNFHFGRMEQ